MMRRFSYALQLRLDSSAFRACMDSNKYEAAIAQDFQDGIQAGVRGTPTYIVNQQKIEGSISSETWDEIILELLQS